MVEGVDYAFSRPNIGLLAALGKKFAVRYGGPGTSPKHLTLAEAQELNAAGLSIVANAEGAADGLLSGYDAGVSWARLAEAHFHNCGMPSGRPIYLSADFDVTASQWEKVREALRGAASVLGAHRVGVYGGYDVMMWARRDGVAAWFWQTYAWSEGRWAAGNHLEQYRNTVSMAGGTLDLDRALVADYGQWTVGGDDMGWEDPLTLVIDGKPVTALAKNWLMGTNDAAWKTLFAVRAEAAADATRDAAVLAAVNALANAGGADAAPIVAQIKAEAEATRQLVIEKHQAEMAALLKDRDAQVAALQAELAGLKP